VNSRCQDDGLSYCDFFWDTCEVGYDQHIDVVTRQTFAEDCLSDLVFVLVRARLLDVPRQVRVGVRVAVGKIYCVVVMLSLELKSQAVIHGPIAVVRGLDRGIVGIYDRRGREVRISSELRRVLIFKRLLLPLCLKVSNIEAVSLPPYLGLL